MDCIPYIEDLKKEIDILEEVKRNSNCNKKQINKIINKKKGTVKKIEINLQKMSGNQIYYKIYLYLLQGLKVSEALEKVSYDNYINDVKPIALSSLWKHYEKMKKILKK